MGKFFYFKLAVSNIKKNGKFYFPYILTCIFTIVMFYMMAFVSMNSKLGEMFGGTSLKEVMGTGTKIIGFFAVLFIYYTNSFLIKRRKKEFGLFNILGMEKRHIARVLFLENIIISIGSIFFGILFGILFSKLIILLLFKILKFDVVMGFEICGDAVLTTIVLFLAIFALILLSNLWKIKVANPIELLRGGNVGEKEPKTKWVLVVIGLITLGGGYILAITTKQPLLAFGRFFIAVIMVIIGTYCLFTAISIAILKALKKNKSFYYKTRNFTSVSGMIYRMKQNAAGLANICILSTAVLITISTTVSLYFGMENILDNRFTSDINICIPGLNEEKEESIANDTKDIISKYDIDVDKMYHYRYLDIVGVIDSEQNNDIDEDAYTMVVDNNTYASTINYFAMYVFSADEYTKACGKEINLNDNEVAVYCPKNSIKDNFDLFDKTYHVKERLDSFLLNGDYTSWIQDTFFVVVKDENELESLRGKLNDVLEKHDVKLTGYYGIDVDGSDEEVIKCAKEIESDIVNKYNESVKDKASFAYLQNKQMLKEDFYKLYGGFLFLGIFLGILFIMATVLIIYYKQITEGYDDKERFEIMVKVGMSRAEIKSTIRRQVIMVFFLPILMAACHIAAAFNMIVKMLEVLNLTDVKLFVGCTVGTIVVFGIFYAIVYALTAKVYYKIVV